MPLLSNRDVQNLGGVHRRIQFASRFLKPISWVKRMQIRNFPRKLQGAFENPVRRFVRLREKSRLFLEIPPARHLPMLKARKHKFIEPLTGIPTVDPQVLTQRLEILLSDASVQMQLAAPLRPGLSPYQAELFVWERQMRDLRRIYRAQYLQKLAEVTLEERDKEQALYHQRKKEQRRRKEEVIEKYAEERKRRALLKEQLRVERKVQEAVTLVRRNKRKKRLLYWLTKLEKRSNPIVTEEQAIAWSESVPELNEKGISVPLLLRQLGHSKRIDHLLDVKADNVFRKLYEESFRVLPEDEFGMVMDHVLEYEPREASGLLPPKKRAAVMYANFTDAEKLSLLKAKLELVNQSIYKRSEINKVDKYRIQLREFIEASIASLEEKGVVEEEKSAFRNETLSSYAEIGNELN